MKHFTHKYNNTFFDFFIFGDRLFTNLFTLCDKISLNHGSPLINYEFYIDIQTYINRLSIIQKPSTQNLYLLSQYQIDSINELIDIIYEKWAENKKEFPDERNSFITDVSLKQFLPLIASHSSNQDLVDCFYVLNNEKINCGLIFNPLLSTEQVTSLINQKRELGQYLIQDTSYKLSPELLQFLVSLDCSNRIKYSEDSEYSFSRDILSCRNNLSEQDIAIILPTLYGKDVEKVILYKDLPQYITESLILNRCNIHTVFNLGLKYKHQEHILNRLTNIMTDGRSIEQVYDNCNLLFTNHFMFDKRF